MTMVLRDTTPKHISEWHEDDGDVLWWRFPITEAPYCGTPNDRGQSVEIEVRYVGNARIKNKTTRVQVGGWPGYHTHWTRFELPFEKWKRGPVAHSKETTDA